MNRAVEIDDLLGLVAQVSLDRPVVGHEARLAQEPSGEAPLTSGRRRWNTGTAMDIATHTRWVVLVEGPSDEAALEALARRFGRDLASRRRRGRLDRRCSRRGQVHARPPDDVRAAGLCDIGEVGPFGRALERAGVGPAGTRDELEALGFYVCDPDLEGELIRALGATGVEEVLGRSGKLSSFRTFQKQPQWRGRPVEAQLRRFFGSSAGKTRHAPLMVEALDLDRVPQPLASLLARVGEGGLGGG